MNLNQVTVPSHDINVSISFYKTLGLKLIVHTHDGYARFECPNGEATFSVEKVDDQISKGVKVYFETTNLDDEWGRLASCGIVFSQNPIDQSWGWREAHLSDPFGNTIILYEAGEYRKNPPWRITD